MAIIHAEYFSQAMRGFRSFSAVLPIDPPPVSGPPQFAPGPWPTLYLLHGFSGSRNDWLRNSRIEMLAAQYGIAVIMPDGDNRFYLDNPVTGENCGIMTGEELVQVTRGMFNLSDRREDTAIGGLSMGGFGAIRNGLRYGDTFGAILAFSSALITEEFADGKLAGENVMGIPPSYYPHVFGAVESFRGSEGDPVFLAENCLKNENAPRLFLACGTEDFLFENNRAYHDALLQMGYSHVWFTAPGVHDFVFWNLAAAEGISWWRSKKEG